MSVSGCYFDSYWGWSQNEAASGTEDFEIPPSNIMATAMMTGMAATNDGWVFSGILEYRKRDPNTGTDQVITPGTLSKSFSLADIVVDSNVDSVTFALGVWDFGEGTFATRGDVVHQIWFT
jgi:hypothetical protein